MQNFRSDLSQELYAIFVRAHMSAVLSSQAFLEVFLEVFGRSVQPYFFPLLSL
jgi:hypothetical protein